MTIVQELYELVKKGATAEYDEDRESPELVAAVKACQIVLKEDYLGMCGWPDKPKAAQPAEKKTFAPRPNDKGYKMVAKLSGTCNICTSPIAIGEDIYYKKGEGANHVACKDEVSKLVP